jgi:hypothetical protein
MRKRENGSQLSLDEVKLDEDNNTSNLFNSTSRPRHTDADNMCCVVYTEEECFHTEICSQYRNC